jgi:6-phosphogluconolactonase
MSGNRERIVGVIGIGVICLVMISCGGASSRPPGCQGTACTPSPTFLYMTSLDHISGFTVDTHGVPASFQNASGPNNSVGIMADPSAKFLYVSDFTNDLLHAFAINRSTGALTAVAGSPFSAGPGQVPGGGAFAGPGGIAIDPNGKFLYVTRANASDVAGFSIDPATGSLTPIAGSTVPVGSFPGQATVDFSGKFLYVSNYGDSQGTISAFSIDPTNGALTPVPGSPFPTQANYPGPGDLVVAGGGKYLYVGMIGTNNPNHFVSAFSIDSTTGVLTQIAGSPFAVGLGPIRIATDPAGKFLFTANSADGTVSVLAIDASTGTLAAVAGSPSTNLSTPIDVAVDQSGKFVYVANWSSAQLSVFALDSTSGVLTPLSGSPFSTGQQQPSGLAIVRTQ